MNEEMKKELIDKLQKLIKEFSDTYEFKPEPDNTALTEWYKEGIKVIIEDYLEDNFDDPDIEEIYSESVETLGYTNRVYTWKITNKHGLIMFAFNDLDYSFNSMVSFDIPDKEHEGEFYKKELECTSFEDCIRFIVKEVETVYKKEYGNAS